MPEEAHQTELVRKFHPGLTPAIKARFEEIIAKTKIVPGSKQDKLVRDAFYFAAEAHAGQHRLSGDPYIVHPLEIMAILADMHVDVVTLVGALLHDVVEDTGYTLEDIASRFGPVVAILVDGMTKLSSLQYDTMSNEEKQAEYFRKMLLSMAQDLRVILIKLADRLHNLRTIDVMTERSQHRIAKETLDIYAPLAHRFGIGKLKMELEDLSLKVLDEVTYRRIAERVAMKREDREAALTKVITPLENSLNKEGIEHRISGRAKHFYSIYNKIKRRGKSFEEILDLLAIRVIVKTEPDCYRTLGIVHNMFTPVVEKFFDYIAMPKGNMYQSLHTKVIDSEGNTVEVQIRTEEMDHIAEVGIAAHWQYKESNKGQPLQDENVSNYYNWLRQLIDGSREEKSSEEFMETLKINLFTDEIIVFTPRGKLIQLPKGSTPIDFAFAVHTDVGLQTLGAKVNNRMVSLNQELKTGDTVQIITSSTAKPSLDWLMLVHSSRARSKIRRHFKQIRLEESIRIGEEMISKELHRHKKKFSRHSLENVLSDLGYQSVESLLAAVGSSDISAINVANKLIGQDGSRLDRFTKLLSTPDKQRAKSGSGIRVQGDNSVLTTLARCCSPLPGDPIIGYISKGRGVIVHRTDCSNIIQLSREKEKLVKVEWDQGNIERYDARLRIYAEDRTQLLRDVADSVGKMNLDICEANLRSEGSLGVGIIVVRVKNLSEVTKLMNRIMKIKGVIQIERVNVADAPD